MKTKPLKINVDTYDSLKLLRGHNGCVTFDDVIVFLLNKFEKSRR